MALKIGQDSRDVTSAFDGWSGSDFDVNRHLGGDDICQGGLAETRRAVKQYVV